MSNVKNKKMMINTVDEFNAIKGIISDEAFLEKFEVSSAVVTRLALRDAIAYESLTDVAMTATQKQMLLKGEF